MKQIAILSGKGGTGKTMLTASFASLETNAVWVDADVDAANLHLLLRGKVLETHGFSGGSKAWIDPSVCLECGQCLSSCRFEAIRDSFEVDPIACEGCGLCARLCPAGAIVMKEHPSGEWFVSSTSYGPFVHAKLGVAEGNSGKLVSKIREKARQIAQEQKRDLVCIDGPPGIGCPVIASLSDVDKVLIVTEPTLSGVHDMERILALVRKFRGTAVVAINKYDLNPEIAEHIGSICQAYGIELAGKIPFSPTVEQAIRRGLPPVECCEEKVQKAIVTLWDRLRLKEAGVPVVNPGPAKKGAL
ncbi:MAG: ATP-binding protein [Candidatus Omnitrophota bacterium]